MKDPCKNCGFLNEYGYCECSPYDKWYACPIENKKTENIRTLQELGKEFAANEEEKTI